MHTLLLTQVRVPRKNYCKQDDGTIGSESFLTLHLGVLLKEGERDSNERYPANAPESGAT
jgi:hypothetical protein